MKTFGDICSGFGGVTVGAMALGLKPLWSVEYNAKIAAVASMNLGDHVIVENLLNVDPIHLDYVDVMHASPPCTRASNANSSAELNEDGLKESPLDIALAEKITQFIRVIQPRVFTLENVWAYRRFQSWRGGNKTKGIERTLFEQGYTVVQVDHVNAADYGVPQTRKRMIVRAVRNGWVPYLPPAQRWVGWYEAIEDLIPTLPESQFAPWQLERLPSELSDCMVGQGGYEGGIVTVDRGEPAFTITAAHNMLNLSMANEPTRCVTVNNVLGWRAFIVDGQNASRATGMPTIRGDGEPMFTVTAGTGSKGIPKAVLPQGRVVSMTPRALARFQSFPDWYQLPELKTLSALGIGNAVPPLMYQRVLQDLISSLQ